VQERHRQSSEKPAALHVAALYRHESVVKLLLSLSNSLVNRYWKEVRSFPKIRFGLMVRRWNLYRELVVDFMALTLPHSLSLTVQERPRFEVECSHLAL
jgi:hypothetical protein